MIRFGSLSARLGQAAADRKRPSNRAWIVLLAFLSCTLVLKQLQYRFETSIAISKAGHSRLQHLGELIDCGEPDSNDSSESSLAPPSALLPLSPSCDLSSGHWVPSAYPSGSAPLYSGLGCPWLAPNWACRRSNRPNFDYEQYEWQPLGCQMPRFNASDFLHRLRNRTLAFIGDSLGQQQFQSLLCMLSSQGSPPWRNGSTTQGDDFGPAPPVIDVGPRFGFSKDSPTAPRPSGWAYLFPTSNTTLLFSWTTCLCLIEPYVPGNASAGQAMHLDRPCAFLRDRLRELDVVVLNTGHHWNRVKLREAFLEFHVNGSKAQWEPNSEGRKRKPLRMGTAKSITVHSIVKWLKEELDGWGEKEVAKGQAGPSVFDPTRPPLVLLRTLSPRHFLGGEWDSGGRCDNLTSLLTEEEMHHRSTHDHLAESAMAAIGAGSNPHSSLRLLNITFLSSYRVEAHPSRWDYRNIKAQDCLHWCLPGVPDVWNTILYAHVITRDMERERRAQ